MTKVKVIQRSAQSALVQWRDGEERYRSFVPLRELKGDQVEAPELGISYGEDWAALITATVDPKRIDQELKRSGIWTIEDLRARVDVAQGAINRVVSEILNDLLLNAKATRQGGKK